MPFHSFPSRKKKIPESKISNPKKSFDHPRHLKSRVPPLGRGFGIREKIRCGLRFFGVFLCGFAVFGPPLRPPPFGSHVLKHHTINWIHAHKRIVIDGVELHS